MDAAVALAAKPGDVVTVDIAILGGGIAGLWLLARARQAGYSAVLIERSRLGDGQSIASQGIIHGGLKYARGLKLGRAAAAIGGMPSLWRRCCAGEGEIDLSAVPLRSPRHLMWVPPGLLGRTAGFFASRAVQSRAAAVPAADWPAALKGEKTVGAVYALDEPVVDVPALLSALRDQARAAIRRIAPDELTIERAGDGTPTALGLRRPGATQPALRLIARRFVFTAGAGNEAVLDLIPDPPVAAQRRPLQMVMVRHVPHELYAHCFDFSDKPRLTITSHAAAAGPRVWYLGGQIAEAGAGLTPEVLIQRARAELAQALPGLSQRGLEWATFAIDRAEAASSGERPDRPAIAARGRSILAWPTKLAFAPLLAAEVLALLKRQGVLPSDRPANGESAALAALADWPLPEVALPPWEEARWR